MGFLRSLFDKTILRTATYIRRYSAQPYSVIDELDRRAAAEAADYVQAHMQNSIHFQTRIATWDFTLGKTSLDGLYMEFGVFNGLSINHFARRLASRSSPPTRIFGFDSFEGLKEDWRGNELGKGAFDRGGVLPPVENNVTLIKGWFDATLPKFLSEHPGPAAFIHVDGDTYEAAQTVLTLLSDRITPGTIILFDEYFGYLGWKTGEHKAWMEFVAQRQVKFTYLAFSITQAAVQVL